MPPAALPWYSRAWGYVVRAVTPRQAIAAVSHGADFAPGVEAQPGYDVAEAMAAYSAFPWVVACLDAKATDLSGLPLRVRRGRGKSAVVLDEHPALDLFARPSRRVGGLNFRRQVVVDFDLSGNWYAAMLSVGGRPRALVRLHPERVTIIPDPVDGIGGYAHDLMGGVERMPPEQVLHVASMSYEAGPEGLYGQGKIRALHLDLTTDLRAQKRAASIAQTGRPDVIISPKSDTDTWTAATMTTIKARYADMLAQGGALVVGAGAKVDLPAWNPRDMEFEKVRLMARDAVLAAFHVPPSRVGLPTANYATQREQMQVYWEALRGDSALYDEEFTRVAAAFDRRDSMFHDFSAIDALQESRDARLARVKVWVDLGAVPAEAAAYEGFDDSPLPLAGEMPAAPAPAPEGERAVLREVFATAGSSALAPLALVMGMPAPVVLPSRLVVPRLDDEPAREALWRGWLDEVHVPAEKRMARATRVMLSAQAHRVAARMGESRLRGVTRDLVGDIVDQLLPPGEQTLMRDAFRAAVRQMVLDAYRDGARQLGERWVLSGTEADAATDAQLAELVTRVDDTTRARLREIVLSGIDAGEPVNAMQARIQADAAFAPSRALLVARTETTRSLAAGHDSAYARFGTEAGVVVVRQWLSARDSEVRDAHAALDGQERPLGVPFVVPGGEFAGQSGLAPGAFDLAALVCNCRCTTVPVLED